MTKEDSATVVLIHGARHDGWCWHLVQRELERLGVTSAAPDLPFTSIEDDIATTRAAVATAPGPVVLVGHSRGGRVITMAGSGATQVKRLVYVAAQMLAEGATRPPNDRSVRSTSELAGPDGQLPLEAARSAFYHDCPDELVRLAVEHLRVVPESARSSSSSVPAAWRSIPSTYVVCTNDRTINPDDQRDMAENANEVIELESSHSPFFSRPNELASIIARYVNG